MREKHAEKPLQQRRRGLSDNLSASLQELRNNEAISSLRIRKVAAFAHLMILDQP